MVPRFESDRWLRINCEPINALTLAWQVNVSSVIVGTSIKYIHIFINEPMVDEFGRLGSYPRNVFICYSNSTLPIKRRGGCQSEVGIALKSWIDGHLRTPLPTFFQTAAGGTLDVQPGQRVATTMVAKNLWGICTQHDLVSNNWVLAVLCANSPKFVFKLKQSLKDQRSAQSDVRPNRCVAWMVAPNKPSGGESWKVWASVLSIVCWASLST